MYNECIPARKSTNTIPKSMLRWIAKNKIIQLLSFINKNSNVNGY